MSQAFHGDGASDSSEGADKRPTSALAKRSGRQGCDKRRVVFPQDDSQLVTGYLEPVNPWQSVEEIPSAELIAHYIQSCEKHCTEPLQEVIRQLQECPSYGGTRRGVMCLSLRTLEPAACEALEAVLRRARFHRIELAGAGLTDQTAVALFDMIEYYESASEIDISGNNSFGILGWQACSRMVNKSQWLEQLEARETFLNESTALVLGRALRPSCVLRCLHLQRSKLAGSPLRCLAGALKQNKSVRELHLGDNQLLPEDAHHLASLLKCNSWLQLLDVSNNQIQDAGIEAIADALAEQSTLHSPSTSSSSESTVSSPQSGSSGSCTERGLAVLVVWNNNLTRNSGQHFSKALSRCRSLEVLNMGQNPLGGEAVNRFRAALQQNRTLLCLGVQGARLGAEAAIALAEVIEDNPVIQRIDLRDNRLQVAGLLALATALRKNSGVTRLDLDEAPPQTNGVEQPLEEARLVDEIHLLCTRNESTNLHNTSSPSSEDTPQRRRVASFTTRKISLTCQTLNRYQPDHSTSEPTLSPPKGISGRLRSPLPSPVPSPVSSPIPSPSHRSRFQVSRVSDSSSITSDSPSPSTPPGSRNTFPGASRFKIVSQSEPPSISIVAPDDSRIRETINVSSQTDGSEYAQRQQIKNSRFSIVRYGNVANSDKKSQSVDLTKKDLVKSLEKSASESTIDTKSRDQSMELDDSKVCLKDVEDMITDSEGIEDSSKLKRKISDQADVEIEPVGISIVETKHVLGAIKKNKSESSLDSPDLEVSRLMNQSKPQYDSTSSLDISGSSMESLNTMEVESVRNVDDTAALPIGDSAFQKKQDRVVFSIQDDDDEPFLEGEQDVFPVQDYKNPFICSIGESSSFKNHGKKLANLSASSNESSLESSTFEAGVVVHLPPCSNQGNLLNSSVSSNESVSPNIFGKYMKLHGSVTSLEASTSSVDSFRTLGTFTFPTSDSQLMDSVDSGICQSETKTHNPSLNESFSSNEGTLTSNSNLKSAFFSMGRGSSLSIESDNGKSTPTECSNIEVAPRRVTSLLDVPSIKTQRSRKISWVAPANSPQTTKKDEEQQVTKAPLTLPEKLLSIFHPGNYFKSDSVDKKGSDSSNSSSRRDSQTSTGSTSGISFWPWNLGSGSSSSKSSETKASAAYERFKKYGESFDLQFGESDSKNNKMDSDRIEPFVIPERKVSEAIAKMPVDFNVVSLSSCDVSSFDSKHLKGYLDSEYTNQTITECVVHPFTSCQISTDCTVRLPEHKESIQCNCTCVDNDSDRAVTSSLTLKDALSETADSPNQVDTYAKILLKKSYVQHDNYDLSDAGDESGPQNQEEIVQIDAPMKLDDNLAMKTYNQVTDVRLQPPDGVLEKKCAELDEILGKGDIDFIFDEMSETEPTNLDDLKLDEIVENRQTCSSEDVPPAGSIVSEIDAISRTDILRTVEGAKRQFDESSQFDDISLFDDKSQFDDKSLFEEKCQFDDKSQFEEICQFDCEGRIDEDLDSEKSIKASKSTNNSVGNELKTENLAKCDLSAVHGLLGDVDRQNIYRIVSDVCERAESFVAMRCVKLNPVRTCDNLAQLEEATGNQVRVVDCDSGKSGADVTSFGDNFVTCGVDFAPGDELVCRDGDVVSLGGKTVTDSDSRVMSDDSASKAYNTDNVDTSVTIFDISATSSDRCDVCADKSAINDDSLVTNVDGFAAHVDSLVTHGAGFPTGDAIASGEHSNKVQNVVLNVCDILREEICIINLNIDGKKVNESDPKVTSLSADLKNDKIIDTCDKDDPGKGFVKLVELNVRPTELKVQKLAYSTVLKQSIGQENKTSPSDRQLSPESGPSVENLPSKIIRRIKENISPENTLTSSMSNTKALAQELIERKNVLGSNSAIWDINLKDVDKFDAILDKKEAKVSDTYKIADEAICRLYDELLVEPIITIGDADNFTDGADFGGGLNLEADLKNSRDKNSNNEVLNKLGDDNRNSISAILEQDVNKFADKFDDQNENRSSLEKSAEIYIEECAELDEGSDALTILDYVSEDITLCDNSILGEDVAASLDIATAKSTQSALEEFNYVSNFPNCELLDDKTPKVAERKLSSDVGKEVVILDALIPQEIVVVDSNVKADSIAIDVASEMIEEKKLPEIKIAYDEFVEVEPKDDFVPVSILKKCNDGTSLPKDIPESKKPFPCYGYTHPIPSKKLSKGLPVRCGSLPENSTSISSSPKSFQETLTSHQSRRAKSRSPVPNTLGKMARDSLYALNMSESEIENLRESGRLASLESVKSLGSVSEDIEDMSSNYVCRSSSDSKSLEPGVSQDSLASLGSISETVSEPENFGGAKGYETN